MKHTTVTCDVCKLPSVPWTIETRDVVPGWNYIPVLNSRSRDPGTRAAMPDVCLDCAKNVLRDLVAKFDR